MESRLPKRRIAVGATDRARRLAANEIKFGLEFPRVPLSLVNEDNPPVYQSMRSRATSPDIRSHTNTDRHLLRRSQSSGDLRHQKLNLLKRGAAATVESIPAKLTKVNATKPPITGGFTVPKPIANSVASKSAVSSIKVTNSANSSKSSTMASSSAKTSSNVKKIAKAPSVVAHKVAVKRIPAYDYKARFNDLSEKHKILKEKYGEIESQAENALRMQQQLTQYEEQTTEMRSELDFLQDELAAERARNQEHEQSIQRQKEQIDSLESETKILKSNLEALTKENQILRPALDRLEITHKSVVSENAELKNQMAKSEELLFQSNMARKQIHNDLLDLKGNIRVFCRVRPQLDFEKNRAMCNWQYMDETSLEISTVDGGKRLRHDFSFDQVFHPQSTQTDIFELVSPLIQSAFDGYNVCIFAYGQTGSGKTFTMEGTPSQTGIIPNTVDLLFTSVQNYKLSGWSYNISVTFLEIYNEVLYDLLSNEQKDLEIRMVNPKTPHEITVSNLTEFSVDSADDLRELIEVAHSHRATAATAGNERSSRSHAVTQIKLTGTHYGRGEKSVGKINLIDLAGSESPKTSNRMDETKNINRSLSELTNVIMALLNQNDHVPYRNSKLTHLLMPSLGGNSKTLMFINVAPFDDCFKESVKSLRFAANVNACKLNKVRKNKTFVE